MKNLVGEFAALSVAFAIVLGLFGLAVLALACIGTHDRPEAHPIAATRAAAASALDWLRRLRQTDQDAAEVEGHLGSRRDRRPAVPPEDAGDPEDDLTGLSAEDAETLRVFHAANEEHLVPAHEPEEPPATLPAHPLAPVEPPGGGDAPGPVELPVSDGERFPLPQPPAGPGDIKGVALFARFLRAARPLLTAGLDRRVRTEASAPGGLGAVTGLSSPSPAPDRLDRLIADYEADIPELWALALAATCDLLARADRILAGAAA